MLHIADVPTGSIGDLPVGVLGSLIAAAIAALVATGWRLTRGLRAGRAAAKRQLETARTELERANQELETTTQRQQRDMETALAYMTHMRDVGQALARAKPSSSEHITERVRREILEPIRGLYTRQSAAEQLRCVWFRLDEAGHQLYMHSQVGHTPQRQRELRLQLTKSVADAAYGQGDTINRPDMAADPRFEFLQGGDNDGSIICTPVLDRNDEPCGVLSVLSTRKHAFGDLETRYVEALAASIGAFEALEKTGGAADAGDRDDRAEQHQDH